MQEAESLLHGYLYIHSNLVSIMQAIEKEDCITDPAIRP